MPNFAIVNKETNIVENSVLADNGSVVALIFEDKDVYEETEDTGIIFIGGDFYKGKFRIPNLFLSWTFNEKKWVWEAPKKYPSDGKLYEWNEDLVDWIEINASTI
jgi:hypothetical protein